MRGSHYSALLYGVVEQRKSRGSTVSTALLESHSLKYMSYRVANCGCGREREVNYAERNVEPSRRLCSNQLSHSRYLERGLLDDVSKLGEIAISRALDSRAYDSGARNAYVYNRFRLSDSVERACHKGIILGHVCEHHELRASHRIVVLGQISRLFDDVTHHSNGIHIYSRLGGGYVYRRANALGRCESLGDRDYKISRVIRKSLLHERAVSADKVYTERMSGAVKSRGDLNVILGAVSSAHERDRSYRHALIDDRNAVFLFNITADRHELLGSFRDLVVYSVANGVHTVGGTVVERDTHGYRTDVKVLLFYHIYSFKNILCAK